MPRRAAVLIFCGTLAALPARASAEPAARTPWVEEGGWPRPAPDHPDRRWQSLAALAGVYAGFSTWAYFAWYHGQPDLPQFEVGGDGYFGAYTYAGGADKLGHAWANLVLARAGSQILQWGGWSQASAAGLGAGLGWGVFLFVEIKDGYYYQLSPGDMIANTAGAALGAVMETVPVVDDLIDFRVAYYPSDEYLGLLRGEYHGDKQVNSLNFAEDYSGQTYYLALHLGALPLPGETPHAVATALDYIDLGMALETRNYKPDAPADDIMSQKLYLGVTLNLQQVLEAALGDRTSGAARRTHQIGHAVFEVLAPPYSILPLASGRRTGGRSGDH